MSRSPYALNHQHQEQIERAKYILYNAIFDNGSDNSVHPGAVAARGQHRDLWLLRHRGPRC